MKKITRVAFDKYTARLAQLNDTGNVAKTFGVAPTVQQKLETKIQESSEFLKSINVIGVSEQEGEKVGLGVSGPTASRTNTDKGDRKTRDLTALDGKGYRCEKRTSTRTSNIKPWTPGPSSPISSSAWRTPSCSARRWTA